MIQKIELFWILLLYHPSGIFGINSYILGPTLKTKFPTKEFFSNDTGYSVTCSAWGKPSPIIEWILDDERVVDTVADLRIIKPNGTLYFPPFPAHLYRREIHSRSYRCRAKNSWGETVSNLIQINAVVKQNYEIQVYDESAVLGNVAVLRCVSPPSVSEHITISNWFCGAKMIYSESLGSKFVLGPNRDLYVYNITVEDSFTDFYCKTINRVTNQSHKNVYPAHISVTETQGKIPPKLLVDRERKINALVMGDAKLSCVAQGYPVPTYKFFREENGRLDSIDRHSGRYKLLAPGLLKIEPIRVEDEGKYVCIVNNSAAEEKVYISLTVTELLNVAIDPSTQDINIGKPTEFKLVISEGWPIVKIEWYHNGQLLINDKRIRISNNGEKLTILEGRKDDHGIYQCHIFNGYAWKEDTAQLFVGDFGPEIIEWFSEQTLQPGPPLTLKCVAAGTPYPTFTWKLDNFPIPDSSRFIVEQHHVAGLEQVMTQIYISSLKDEDGGLYSCTAKNRVGEVSHSALINVYGVPYIRPMPKVTAISGSRLLIKCPVAGYPIETITWEQGGVLLPVNRRQRVYQNGTLVIDQVHRMSDSGTYTCQAQNRQKHSARRDVEVHILIPPKVMPIPPMTNLLQEGMRASITCQIIEGDLPIQFQWIKTNDMGEKIDLNAITRRIDEYTSSLIIEVVRSSHAGNYTCITRNLAGQEEFTVPLTVNVEPKWINEPKDINVSAGKDVILNCQADGYPVPIVVWKKAIGDNPGEYKDFLYQPNLNFFRNGSLEFLHIDKTSEGHYMCEAKNGIGTGISKVIYLKVNSPVYFVQKSKQLNILKNDQAHLQCNAIGDNPIQITWKGSKGQELSTDMDTRYAIREQILDEGLMSELGISKVFRHDTGSFTCHAKNPFGQDEMTVELIVQEVPEVPKNVRVTDQGSRSFSIVWNQPYSGNSPIINYIIQTKLSTVAWSPNPTSILIPGTKSSAVIGNLVPATVYHLRISAENSIGRSESSDEIQIATQEEAPGGPPRDIQIKAESSTELFVTWNSPSKDLWNGNLLGYNVGYYEVSSNTTPECSINNTVSSSIHHVKTVDVGPEFGGQTTITGLKMYTSYYVVVQAFNSHGAGPCSEPISAQTEEGVPSMAPENVKCTPITSQSIQIAWSPPPLEGRNGLIQGYKVLYQPCEDWYERNEYTTKTTTAQMTTVPGLLKYTNYSFVLLAYTKHGDGVKSTSVFCRTEEDVPSAPAGIKAFISSLKKIVVSWLPPIYANGELTGYTLYMAIRNGAKENGTQKRMLPDTALLHETARLQESATYQFWITSSTKIGEGESTRVISVLPSTKVPARIISFNQEIISPWKKNVSLPCLRVGIPAPKLVWTMEQRVVTTNDKIEISKDGVLILTDIQQSDAGNYTCSVENVHGRDQITYAIYVRVPPEPPELTVINEDTDSLHLAWRDTEQPDIPILGYVINYKRDHGDWEEIHIDSRTDTYELRNLWCGTRYQLYMAAFNKIGTGLPCDIVTAYTKGSVPMPPVGIQQALMYNTTSASIWLDVWNDGGCSILYFIIEYKTENQPDWIVTSKPVNPSDRIYIISDLQSATRYQLRITAHNNIGSTIQIYNFTTLTEEGGLVIPLEFATSSSGIEVDIVFSSLTSIISIIVLIVILTGVCTTVCYIKRKRYDDANECDETVSVTELQNQLNHDKQYGVKSSRSQQTINTEPVSCKTDSSEYIDEICPYATFQLSSKPPYAESTFSGNVYSGPYHSVGSSFVYHNVKPSGSVGSSKCQGKDHQYMKVKNIRPCKGRDPLSESQESDNLGSTDSEVKKILARQCDGRRLVANSQEFSCFRPIGIQEYDTQESDSDTDVIALNGNSQELMLFRPIGPREDSSSSSEITPPDTRKSMPPLRKPKWKEQTSGKQKCVKSSSGYSSHAEETIFSFRDPSNIPSCFSDSRSHPRGYDETESSSRRSSRSSAGRLTQETSFQIDV